MVRGTPQNDGEPLMSKYLNSVSSKALAVAALLALGSTSAFAEDDAISASVGASYNSHFVSYGADVWGGGDAFFGSRSTTFVWGDVGVALGDGWSTNFGAWADVNKNVPSGIGGSIQEVDVYLGATYAVDIWTFNATYQAWSYAADVEQVMDFSIALNDADLFLPFALNPKATFHIRVDGNGAQKEGTAIVLGVGPSFPLDDTFSLSIPAGIAFFADDNFQGGAGETVGYGYLGGSLGIALPFPSTYGTWSANVDLIGYFTSPAAIPGNVKSDFLTASFGVKVAF